MKDDRDRECRRCGRNPEQARLAVGVCVGCAELHRGTQAIEVLTQASEDCWELDSEVSCTADVISPYPEVLCLRCTDVSGFARVMQRATRIDPVVAAELGAVVTIDSADSRSFDVVFSGVRV